MTVLVVDPADPDPDDIARAAAALAAGQLVVMPTDSVYGLAADPALPAAVSRLFEAKGRPRSLSIPVLVASMSHVDRLVEVDDRARRLIERYWPGPLTIVLPRRPGVDWELGEARATLAVRMPDHPVALALLTRTGPLAVTSANRSGESTPATVPEIEAVLGDRAGVYLDAGPAPLGTPSALVSLVGPALVLREGPIDLAELMVTALQGTPEGGRATR
ncbi:MAG TPA: L-threonylcarbamoyladenylate synthase [Actinomycetota bacterium]|nr:L-threonylcarbamoyladenylate synthase [Actinomycetota bacterium]